MLLGRSRNAGTPFLWLLWLAMSVVSRGILADQPPRSQESLRRIVAGASQTWPAAVVAEGVPLLHTAQLLPLDADGQLVGPDDLKLQIDQLLDRLEAVLAERAVRMDQLVKLNLYARDAAALEELLDQLELRLPAGARPAMASVVTNLPHGAAVALDSVAAVAEPGATRVAAAGPDERQAQAALLPRGDVVYVSGQAARERSLADATRETLSALERTLEHLGLGLDDVVQVKCFLHPIQQSELVQRQLQSLFSPKTVPPVAYVEWISSLPIEIELVARAPHVAATRGVTYLTPPWMTASPVFSRVARIHGDRRIYVSGLVAGEPGDGAAQVRGVFAQLDEILNLAGSDLRHLAKATYYVSTDDASQQLNQLRPDYYDPQRPPAASKAMVRAIGVADRSLTLDIIAAPSAGTGP